MKTEHPLLVMTIEDIAGDVVKRRFIGTDGDYAAEDGAAIGVSYDDADEGETLSVIAMGIAIVEAGGSITAGNLVAVKTDGKAKAATAVSVAVPSGATPVTSTGAQPTLTVAGGALPQRVVGVALDDASDGNYFRVKLF